MTQPYRLLGHGALLALALLAAACGGSSGPRSVLGEAVRRIGQIRAGDLFVRFSLDPSVQSTSGTVGFTLQGSFALDRRLPLPILHVAFTQLAGTQTKSTRIDSNGRSATVLEGRTPVPLNQPQRQALASTLTGPRGLGDLPLHIDRWVAQPREAPGPSVGGRPTEQVSGRVNLRQALADLDAISPGAVRRAGGPQLNSRLQRALRSSVFIADVGRRDHLLRRLYVRVTLAPVITSGPSPTRGLTIIFDLEINPRPLRS